MKILLASSSIYRRQLMDQIGLRYSHKSPQADERQLENEFKGAVDQLPQHLAQAKAQSLIDQNKNGITIGCDQMALLGKEILHKPGTTEKAQEQLERLSGQSHNLITAISVHSQGLWLHDTVITTLKMKKLSAEYLHNYVTKEQPIDCAGSYKIEGLGIVLFESIKTTDFTSIIGLPLLSLSRILDKFNCSPLKPKTASVNTEN